MTTIDTLLKDIQQNRYLATDSQVGELVVAVWNGRQAESTYLKVLIAKSLKHLHDHTPLQAVNKAHEKCLAVARGALSTPDMKPQEINRKLQRFYSSASTLRKFVQARCDMRELSLDKVSKLMLRRAVEGGALAKVKGESRAARSARKAQGQLTRALTRLLGKEPAAARTQAQATIRELEKLLRSGASLRKAA